MLQSKYLAGLATGVVIACACGTAAVAQQRKDEAKPGPRILRDLEYARPGDQPQSLDLYLPRRSGAAEKPLPVVVWVHGGAWRAGDKRNCRAAWLTEHGYAVASVNYRLSQTAKFPAQLQDCRAAIRWLRGNAEQYALDGDRIGAWGSSAGGHLVALLGVAGGSKKWKGDESHAGGESRGDESGEGGKPRGRGTAVSSEVRAVCDFFGPTDFLQMDAHSPENARIVHDAPDSPESLLIGGPIQDHPELVARANPLTYVDRDDPPFLIMHGDRDPLVPLHQSRLLHAALSKAGVPCTLEVIEGAGHGFGGPQISARVLAFFDKHLKHGAKKANGSSAPHPDRRGGDSGDADRAAPVAETPLDSPQPGRATSRQEPAETFDFQPRTLIKRPFRAITAAPAVPADEAAGLVDGNELVMGVVVNGAARAYPINMLVGPRREIVNDKLGGRNIAATW